jgi:uncharacterized damage-inducible protein DinB
MTIDQLLDTWRASNVINLEILDLCHDEDFELKPGKGKTIRSNFVHIIGFRRAWCEAEAKDLAFKIPKLDWKTADRGEIRNGLTASHDAMIELFKGLEAKENPKMTAVMMLGYAIAHEANHRAQIEIALRLNGKEPTNAELYRLWEWAKK